LEHAAYALKTGATPTPLDLSGLKTLGDPRPLIILITAWLVYYIYSDFRKAWWVVPVCAFALIANVYLGYLDALEYDADWAVTGSGTIPKGLEITPYMYVAGLIPLHLLFLMIAVWGQQATHSHDHSERRLLTEYHSVNRPWVDATRSLLNIPEAIKYAKGRVWPSLLMFFAGVANFMNFWRASVVFVFVCMIPPISYSLFPNIDLAIKALLELRQLKQVAFDLSIVAFLLCFYLLLVMIIPWVIAIAARYAVRAAERRMRNSLEDIQHKDKRAPVLFLRSFLNDQVPLVRQRRSLKQWMLDGAGSLDTLDMMILAEGTRIGPTVALGNPDDPAPPYGVARGYFDHDDWQNAVMGLCAKSAAIVLVLDETEGLEWEIGHIAAKKHLAKTLFLLAPEDVGTPRGHQLLGHAIGKSLDRDLDETIGMLAEQSDQPAMGFMLDAGTPQLLTVERAKQYSYLTAIRRFLRLLPDQRPNM
ncbi:MAG: hypothetical protein ABJF80_01495, partial [Marinomonas sp.]